VKKDNLRLLVM